MEISIIQNKICEIRNRFVMFDFDLAAIYGIQTKRLKEQVRRNIERFPADFMFELSQEEWSQLVAICDQLPKNLKHSYVAPYVFTQEGVAMLSSVLRTPLAIQMNINIMRAFVSFRNYFFKPLTVQSIDERIRALEANDEELLKYMNNLSEDTRNSLQDIHIALSELAMKQKAINEQQNKPRFKVGYVK